MTVQSGRENPGMPDDPRDPGRVFRPEQDSINRPDEDDDQPEQDLRNPNDLPADEDDLPADDLPGDEDEEPVDLSSPE